MAITDALSAASSLGSLGALMAVAASAAAAAIGFYRARQKQQMQRADQREVDAIHAEIAHTTKVAGVDEAKRLVDLVYAESLAQMSQAQKEQAQMLQNNPLAMAQYVQSIIDKGEPDAHA